MRDAKSQRYEALARILKAMASPTRLLLVDVVARNEGRCVCELAASIDADISTVSRHLQLLKETGILTDEKRGKMIYYHLRTAQVRRFLDFSDCCLRNAPGS